MIKITISEETESKDRMCDALRQIADMIENGYTSGIDPTFELEGENEERPDDEELEGSAVIQDSPNGYKVSFCNDYLGECEDFETALADIKERANQQQFYPSIYHVDDYGNISLINDHGNLSLLDKEGKEI